MHWRGERSGGADCFIAQVFAFLPQQTSRQNAKCKMQNATDQEARCIRILQTNQEYPLRRKFACTSPVPAEAGKLIIHETNQSMQINQTDPCCTFAEWRQLRK